MQATRRALIGALAALPALRVRAAPAWPSRPIRLVLPYSAGGPTDTLARALAAKLSAQLGQTLVVENKTGASGNIACETVARADPDGYTLLYHSSGLAISPALHRRLSYDPVRDFSPIAQTASIPLVIMAAPTMQAGNIKDFVAYLRDNPDKLSYGTGGVGNITHLSVALFLHATGTRAVGVPYQGTAPAMVAMLGGQVQFMADAVSSGLPYIRDGRVRALAVTGTARSTVLPDAPTLAETVMPDFEASTWHGVLAPAGTPPPIIDRLNAALRAAVGDAQITQQFSQQGVDLKVSTPQQFGSYLRAEVDRWRQAVEVAGIQPE
ncbi:tripartite tricarboxylate transporter substrate binding protein [Bordetella sp. BOR01]|uniref:Bug family tripartite tricarboxylate transporter substrate binding protein n=1 Tax=Bordetella sp. BOR01 TaxID=2854779 RepID=UPI001C472D15|nr:tripartite tricarboxylate transporter substrate binding protein [Bordetella sp. BOR01]MBV7486257.1 tripartite tricarboxylate transporter substrate binding protein [Bordetella sp. BOR01]